MRVTGGIESIYWRYFDFFLIAFFTFSMQSYSFSFRELRFNAVDFY